MKRAEENTSLRDELLAHIFPRLDKAADPIVPPLVDAAAACIGAAAVVIATMPVSSHATVIEQFTAYLPKAVEKRAREIRSGKFDRDQARARN